MIKKIFLSIFVALFLLTHIATPAKADTWFNQDPINWYKKVYDTSISPEPEIFGERYTAAQVQWIFYSVFSIPINFAGKAISCAFVGEIPCILESFSQLTASASNVNSALAIVPQREGALNFIFKTDRPFSGISYVRSSLRDLKVIPEANAQTIGFGFSALEPVRLAWQGFRNLSYVFLIFATIVLAFMIMFRVKISPQVVVTAQSAIPKLVIAIILITFSYAIAGFLIDLMYIAIGLVSLALTTLPTTLPVSAATYFGLMTRGFLLLGLIGEFAIYFIVFLVTLVITLVANFGILGSITLSALLGFLVFIIVAIGAFVLIWMFFKTFFMLLKAFTNIILLTIFAPLQFLAGTLVENLGFNAWLRSMIANLSVFVVVGLLFQFSKFFLTYAVYLAFHDYVNDGALQGIFNILVGSGAVNLVTQESAGWPPLISSGTSGTMAFLMLGVSYVMFSLIPKTADVIQGFITGRQFAYGSAAGEAIGAPGRIIGGVTGTIANISKNAEQIARIPSQFSGTQNKAKEIADNVVPE